MKAKSIFFDLDNTLWDFNASANLALQKVYQLHLHDAGISEAKWREIYHRHNHELWHLYRLGKATSEEVKVERFTRSFAELGVADLPAPKIAAAFLQMLVDETVLFPGVVETLTVLAKTYKLGVITNGFAASKERLGVLGLDKVFCSLITSEAVGVPKPGPTMFLHALELVGCEPHEFVYVGDDYETDVVGAKAAGVKAILFNHQGADITAKEPEPDAVIYTFPQLMDLFRAG